MRSLPTDKAVKRYVGSWGEFMDSIGVSWDDQELYFDDEFQVTYCDHCPDQDVCVLEPEEYEDECPQIRSSEQMMNSGTKLRQEQEK